MATTLRIKDTGQYAFEHRIAELKKQAGITVGVHAEQGQESKKQFAHKIGPVREGDSKAWKKVGGGDLTLIDVASAHEFGIGVPPRPFIGGWVDEAGSEADKALSTIMTQAAKGTRTVEQCAQRFGAWAVGQVQKRIADGIQPDLADSTKVRKAELTGQAKDTPLILTGQLRSSIRSKVTMVK
jgi:hypothetical protein